MPQHMEKPFKTVRILGMAFYNDSFEFDRQWLSGAGFFRHNAFLLTVTRGKEMF
jgi:hypothetical protein